MGTVDGAGICIFCKSFGRLVDIFDFLLICRFNDGFSIFALKVIDQYQ
jgi:hypothetical protein